MNIDLQNLGNLMTSVRNDEQRAKPYLKDICDAIYQNCGELILPNVIDDMRSREWHLHIQKDGRHFICDSSKPHNYGEGSRCLYMLIDDLKEDHVIEILSCLPRILKRLFKWHKRRQKQLDVILPKNFFITQPSQSINVAGIMIIAFMIIWATVNFLRFFGVI